METNFKNVFLKKLQHVADETEARYAKKTDLVSYSIEKQGTAEEGYASSYRMTADGTPVGDVINIPKDYMVKDASTKECTEAGIPLGGLAAGDKYIDFTVNTAGVDGEEKHIYLAVKDIMVKCTGGNGISVDGAGTVSVKINAESANGLSASESGLALALATKESAGAMSASDKAKLDGAVTVDDMERITEEEIRSLFGTQAQTESGTEQA